MSITITQTDLDAMNAHYAGHGIEEALNGIETGTRVDLVTFRALQTKQDKVHRAFIVVWDTPTATRRFRPAVNRAVRRTGGQPRLVPLGYLGPDRVRALQSAWDQMFGLTVTAAKKDDELEAFLRANVSVGEQLHTATARLAA